MTDSNLDLNELVPITKNFTKKEESTADIVFDGEYFQVSDELYNRLNLNDNGFKLFFHPQTERAFLMPLPVEQAVHYRGKKGYPKTKKFTSSKMIDKLSELGILEGAEEQDLWLKNVGKRDGTDVYEILTFDPKSGTESGQTDTSSEENQSGEFADIPREVSRP